MTPKFPEGFLPASWRSNQGADTHRLRQDIRILERHGVLLVRNFGFLKTKGPQSNLVAILNAPLYAKLNGLLDDLDTSLGLIDMKRLDETAIYVVSGPILRAVADTKDSLEDGTGAVVRRVLEHFPARAMHLQRLTGVNLHLVPQRIKMVEVHTRLHELDSDPTSLRRRKGPP